AVEAEEIWLRSGSDAALRLLARAAVAVDSGQGPGRPGQGRRGGAGPGRGPRGGGRGDRRDRRDRDAGSSSAARVVPELSVLEKALAKADLAGQLRPLDAVVKALRQARARSLQDLDMDTRGRLITTLSRVARQPRPTVSNTSSEAPAAEAVTADASSGAPQTSSEASEASSEVSEASSEVSKTSSADGESAAGDGAAGAGGTKSAAAPMEAARVATEVSNTSSNPYGEVLFRVGLAWSAVGESDRAESAFGAAGRRPSAEELRPVEAPRTTTTAPAPRGERPPR